MANLILDGLSKTYPAGRQGPAKSAVRPLDLAIRDGEFLALVGPSGCGKSTMLRMIAGLEEASSGSIFIDGRRVDELPPHERDIAMVFQNYALYPHMTVYDNMAFSLRFRGLPKDEIRRRVGNAARMLGLTEPDNLLGRKPKALSGGQRQRVALGRAMVRQAGILLFDEPLSNLDAKMRVEMRAEISRLHREIGATSVYVTHDQSEAMTMADRIVVMDQGVVRQTGTPREIYLNPGNVFVATFVGTPPMNLIGGFVEDGPRGPRFREEEGGGGPAPISLDLAASRALLPERLHCGRVLLGFRPEDVRLVATADHPSFVARIEFVENSGSESCIYFGTATSRLAAKAASAWDKPLEGSSVGFTVDQARIHFFDPATGQRFT